MYLGTKVFQIVSTPQYDVSCEETLVFHPEVGKLSVNCRGM